MEHPLDLTKVRLQSQPLDRPPRYTGPWDCIVQTYRTEGIRAFWRVRFSRLGGGGGFRDGTPSAARCC